MLQCVSGCGFGVVGVVAWTAVRGATGKQAQANMAAGHQFCASSRSDSPTHAPSLLPQRSRVVFVCELLVVILSYKFAQKMHAILPE